MDRTAWSYDAPTGLLTNKVYAAGKGTSYSYTPEGKLATRAWARGVTTTYAYTNGSSLAAIDYSVDTPDVAFTYDRLGRMTSATTDGVSSNANAYSLQGLLTNEMVSALNLSPSTLHHSHDALGRPSDLSLDATYVVTYGYDTFGRLATVTATVGVVSFSAAYSRLPASGLLEATSITIQNSTFDVRRSYEPHRDLIAVVSNTFGGAAVSTFAYANDALDRRTLRVDDGAVTNAFGYNPRSELTTALMDTNAYSYAYDGIGIAAPVTARL